MKLATLDDGTRDGALVVVSSDLTRAIDASPVATTLQEALDHWADLEGDLQHLYRSLQADDRGAFPFLGHAAPLQPMAPLPRAWQWLDASAFESHGDLMARAFNMDPAPRDRPLMYQGMSDHFFGPYDDVPFPSEALGIDFEGEFGVIVDETPMGVSAEEAAAHIRLIIQINDWSLRTLAPIEMKTGFGWVQAKPACSAAPVAVTPDELGLAWSKGRVALPLNVRWNGELFGSPNGDAMAFSFPELVAHAARTRRLTAGTIVGSGTVSNVNYHQVGSTCIAERRAIELMDLGGPRTGFMQFGDVVEMECRTADDRPLFGAIRQKVGRA